MELKVGMPAPPFTLPGPDGRPVALSGLSGRKVVLYFYPRDDTPGCTVEARDFDGLLPEFAQAETELVGISPDGPQSHAKFAAKHGLSLTLVSDESQGTLKAYGVWAEKSMYGRTFMGVERTTVLIGRDGTIARIWPKVKVGGHAQEVLEAARAL
ncbi:MAG: peroxiredoxin [Enterovirga sp.]|nr:peroxiredoxin [Enterovirga sp.]